MKKINRRKFIHSSSLLSASGLFFGFSFTPHIFIQSKGFDILIRNGSILDGTGKKEFISDLGIKDGKITAIGNLSEAEADLIIAAKGLKVVPGFIDIHSHTDSDLIINPKAESKIRQGVTTEITGQDGFSWGPLGGPELEIALKNFKEEFGEELSWRTLEGFIDNFSSRKFSVNVATMLGLGTVREFVVGLDDRTATTEELKKMQEEVAKAVNSGAVGLSTGLEYTPGSFASTEELIELCKAAPEKFRVYSTHMRNEDNTVLEAIDEAIKIAKESGSRLLISHLKVSGKSNWHKADEALAKIDKAIQEGLEVHADRYTYVAYHTNLSNLFPLWARDGGTEKFLERLKDKSDLKKMKDYTEQKVANLDREWDGVLISSIFKTELKEKYQGKTIKQISQEEGRDGFDASVKILLEAENQVMMMGFGMEESSTEKILAHPRVMIASDAGSHAPYPPMNKSIAHPRAYGTFPRAIARYVRERKICSLEEMIKKMTSMPADKIGFTDRGRLAEGKAADVTLFDYEKIRDKAEFTNSHQYPDGIPYVIVNGEVVINNGEHTGAMTGKVLRS
ncbi:MAG TPA: D-aminoacylase [Ignavibacteriaceae bacterium]|nr:D-aminoacylase [Ignavibacteriaceae bacterium]